MAINFITPNLVDYDGRIVEISDPREPDVFDRMAGLMQDDESAFDPSVRDEILDMSQGFLPWVALKPEVAAIPQIPRLIKMAKLAKQQMAYSYRGFHVGAAAYATSSRRPMAGFIVGANYKPYEGAPKYCAEMAIVDKAKKYELDRLHAVAVYGPADFDDVNELGTPTLHPCSECRTMFQVEPLVTPELPITTTNDTGAIEIMHAADLINLHDSA